MEIDMSNSHIPTSHPVIRRETMSAILTNQDLLARLITVQNHPANVSRDIMTIAGMMPTREELQQHIVSVEMELEDAIGWRAYQAFDMSRPAACFKWA